MHELSIVLGIIELAERHASASNATVIEEVELDIGTLSGIELNALDFAWNQAIKGTMLQQATKKVNSIPAWAKCLDCEAEFAIAHYYNGCPVCGKHLLAILQGKELRLKSLLVQ